MAASDVCGLALDLRGFASLALFLWLAAVASWAGLIYLGFGVLMFRNTIAGVDVAHGAWLNAIVATQSLVVLGVHATAGAGPTVAMLLYALWSVGLGLYGIYVALLCQRIFLRS